MSDTDGMVRLMEHAAQLLNVALREQGALNIDGATQDRDRAIQRGTIAAMASAEATLRMVAASVTPASDPLAAMLAPQAIQREGAESASRD